MSNILKIAVIIPTMNRPMTLKRTIDCIMEKNYIPEQIIIIDQSQSDINRSANKLCMANYSGLIETIYIYQEKPSSTVARNAGFAKCKNEIVIYLDDDVDINNETLINVYNIMQNTNIAMVAGIDENLVYSKANLGYFFDTKSFIHRRIGHITLSMLGRYPDNVLGEVETMCAMGYFFVVRKSLADRWKLRWDENLTNYAYAEDLDYTYSYYKMAKNEKLRCILSDKVKVKHLVSREYRIPSVKSTYMYVINRNYLSYKHRMGFRSQLAIRWTNIGQLLKRIIKGQAPLSLIKAQLSCDRNRKFIKSGIIKDGFYK